MNKKKRGPVKLLWKLTPLVIKAAPGAFLLTTVMAVFNGVSWGAVTAGQQIFFDGVTEFATGKASLKRVLAAFFLLRITENSRIKSDAAIAMISASSLAIGIIVTSLTTGMTTDVSSYMFGSILAMTKEDVMLSAVLCIIVLGLFVLCYNQVFAVTFDENFAKATGVNVGAYNMLISVLTAVTIVLGMRMMGAMLISSLVIFPCLTSMRVFKSFTSVVVSSGILSLVCFLLGMMASYQFSMPAGASVVVVNLIAFGLFSMWQVLGKKR